MTIIEALLAGLADTRRHWGQTFLALIGLILGAASIVAVLSLFGGQLDVTDRLLREQGGANTLLVRNRDAAVNATARERNAARLSYRDVRVLEDRARSLVAVSAEKSLNWLPFRARGARNWYQVTGTVPGFASIVDVRPSVGRFLGDVDLRRNARVVVLGAEIADSIFGGPARALHQRVDIGGHAYRVIGVLEREELSAAPWAGNALEERNRTAYVPLTTAAVMESGDDGVDMLTLRPGPRYGATLAESEVRSLLAVRHGVDNIEVQPPDPPNQPLLAFFAAVFLLIGGVALVASGVVIANILLASVVERVRELGTRMALGATGPVIFAHVLAQVVVVAVVGGAAGLALGWALTGVVGRAMQLPTLVDARIAALAFLTTVVTGLAAGCYPAFRAARLSPVEALRYG